MTISFYFAYFFSFRIFLIIVYNSSDLCFFVSWVPCIQDIIQFRGCLPMTPLTVSITAELKFAIMELRSVFSTAGTMCSSNLRSVLVLDYQILHSFSFLQTQHTDVCSNRFRRIYFLSAMYDWQTYRMYEIMTQWAIMTQKSQYEASMHVFRNKRTPMTNLGNAPFYIQLFSCMRLQDNIYVILYKLSFLRVGANKV